MKVIVEKSKRHLPLSGEVLHAGAGRNLFLHVNDIRATSEARDTSGDCRIVKIR